ncbi:hypothetical protein [Massilia sp. DD77]|uniref:hypothetical protein n=1 Tax=Massilia sp. DD77 TaxID=3109349 RepID=UPI003000C997
MDELEQLAATPDSNAADTAAAEDRNHDAQHHDDQVDLNSQEQIEEDEEIEVGGKKFALPKSAAEQLKAERLMQADYTRKTQEVAETRKAIEAEREQVRQHAQQQQQYVQEIAKVVAIDEQLAEYQKLDWQDLIDRDPVGAQKLQAQMNALQNQRHQAAQAVTQKQNEHALAEQQTLAKQVQEAEAYVQREIPGWNQETATRLNSYAEAQGVKIDQSFAKLMVQQPALIKILHQAEMFNQLAKKQSTKPQAPTAPPAPVTRVGASRASAKPDPAKQSDADWYRDRQQSHRKR